MTTASQGASPPIFLLSFRQRDELAGLLATEGWRLIAARRAEGAARRFAASGAAVAIVDARGAIEDGLAALAEIAPIASAQGAAVLILLSKGDADRVGAAYDAGATHFLLSPMSGPELAQALRFAKRYADRMGGSAPRGAQDAAALGWRYDPAIHSFQMTPELAGRLPGTNGPLHLLRTMEPGERRLALAAARRAKQGGSTAFAHALGDWPRVVTHLQYDPQTRRWHALVEPLVATPDPKAELGDMLGTVRDGPAARRWIEHRMRDDVPLSVILIGLGQFAAVNSAYGRAAGDVLLTMAAKRLGAVARELLGKGAMVARIGGAEFVIAAAEQDEARIELVAGRAVEALQAPFLIAERPTSIEVRASIATSVAGDDAAALLRRASEGLVDLARPGGGDLTPQATAVADQLLGQLARDITGAIDGDQIDILFQPQVTVASGAITGVEALARWRHPALGELGAETLFAAAARAGLIRALSDHVQRRALAMAVQWPQSLARLRLSVNVTSEDVARDGFADILLDRVDASGFARARLTIEVTESGLIEDLNGAARLLAELRTAGCRVAIDDFGTGYSSLAYLKALPLDYLKIDRKLSQDIVGTARDRIVVRGVIDMARSLGLTVIAEGVETEEQLELLAKEGCQIYQGFLCAEPIDTPALSALVEGRAA